MPETYKLLDVEKKILDYVSNYQDHHESFIIQQFVVSGTLESEVSNALKVLAHLGLIELHSVGDDDFPENTVSLTAKGLFYLQGRDMSQNTSQSNEVNIIGSTIVNSSISQRNQNSWSIEVQNVLAPIVEAMGAEVELSEAVREELRKKERELVESLEKKDKRRFDAVKEIMIALLPKLVGVFQRPELQQGIQRIFGIG